MIQQMLDPTQQQARDAVLQRLAGEQAAARLWQRDASLWHPAATTQARIRQRLGWLRLPADNDVADAIDAVQRAAVDRSAAQIVYVAPGVLGRAARVWLSLVNTDHAAVPVIVLDTADPVTVAQSVAARDRTRTLTVHAGPFPTPQAQALAAALPTDLHVPLPPAVGERFAALTAPALVPAALHGFGWHAALQRVRAMVASQSGFAPLDHPGFQLGAALGTLAQAGRDLLHIVAIEHEPLARWIAALVGGALGKHRRGFVPIVGQPPTAQHAHNNIVVQIVPNDAAASDRMPADHVQFDAPTIRCSVGDAADIAELVWTWQIAVTVAALVIGLNPFDAPDADTINARILQQIAHAAVPTPFTPDTWQQQLEQARFVVIAAYTAPDRTSYLERLRVALARALAVPVMLVFPLRDWLWTLQLLHAGRPGGAIVAVTEHADDQKQQVAQLRALTETQLAVELETWQRMGRAAAHVQITGDAAHDVAQLLGRRTPMGQ